MKSQYSSAFKDNLECVSSGISVFCVDKLPIDIMLLPEGAAELKIKAQEMRPTTNSNNASKLRAKMMGRPITTTGMAVAVNRVNVTFHIRPNMLDAVGNNSPVFVVEIRGSIMRPKGLVTEILREAITKNHISQKSSLSGDDVSPSCRAAGASVVVSSIAWGSSGSYDGSNGLIFRGR
jgi:hypothetical protein